MRSNTGRALYKCVKAKLRGILILKQKKNYYLRIYTVGLGKISFYVFQIPVWRLAFSCIRSYSCADYWKTIRKRTYIKKKKPPGFNKWLFKEMDLSCFLFLRMWGIVGSPHFRQHKIKMVSSKYN